MVYSLCPSQGVARLPANSANRVRRRHLGNCESARVWAGALVIHVCKRLALTFQEPMLPAPEEAGIDEAPTMPATDPPAIAPETGTVENPAIRQEAETLPQTTDPVIELISEPPHEEPGSRRTSSGSTSCAVTRCICSRNASW